MPKYECSIYENRPLICKLYPVEKWTGFPTNSCSYYLKDGKMVGECSRCGRCCNLFIDIHKFGKKFVQGEPCPYLKEIV